MPSLRTRFIGQFKGLSFLIILHVLSVNEASSLAQLAQAHGSNHGLDDGGRVHQPQAPISFSPQFPYNDHHLPTGALASKREPPRINTYVPNPSLQSKRLGGPINRIGFNPSGRVDSIPGLNNNINSPRNSYNDRPPNFSSGPSPKKSSSPPKSVQSARSPRIQKPFVSDGYIDAGDSSFKPQTRQNKIDGLRNPNNLLPPSIEGTKIDNVGVRRSIPPPQPPSRPRNPYADKSPQFRSGREYNNAQRNAQFDNAQNNADFSKPQSNPTFNNAPRNPSFNSAQSNVPLNKPQRDPPFKSAPRNPSFNSAPTPRDIPDYTQRYNEPQRHSDPQHSNSSFDKLRNVDFAPYDRPSSQNSPSNSPDSIPALPDPFQFSGNGFAFPSSSSFGARSPRARPSRTFNSPSTDLFKGFSNSNPLGTNAPAIQPSNGPTNNVPQQRAPVVQVAPNFRDNRAITANPNNGYQDPRRNPLPANRGPVPPQAPVVQVSPNFRDNRVINANPNNGYPDPRRNPVAANRGPVSPLYGNGAAAGIYGNGASAGIYGDPAAARPGQCFQYSFPAEAYRLSDLAKDYPSAKIQAEIDAHPYLAPLVGVEAKAVTNDPFTFNAPISSQFDFSGFGFKNDATTTPDKYAHLKNVRAYPGNVDKGELAGRYPSSMQPLDSACPSNEYSLKSFFHQGSNCFVVNPDFQQITYHRCTRQDCNFCGVNRGLSACVEEYRWVSVVAYCSGLQENTRIAPMKLSLPVGCSCQHFVC